MRILLVTPFVPVAMARSGGSAYLAALVSALADRADLGLVALADEARLEPHGNAPWKWLGTAQSHDAKGRTGLRRLQTLWRWRHLPLVAAKAWQSDITELLARARTEFAPDVALVEMAQMAQYLPCLRGIPTILTDHEAGCAANTRTGLGQLGDRRDRHLWRNYVLRHFKQATAVQAVTPEDADLLQNMLGRTVLARPPAALIAATPVDPATAPPRMLFLGDYRHGPNPEAADRLVRDVLPRVRELEPRAELWLAGPNEAAIRHLAAFPGVRVLGFVADLAGLFAQVRLLLAPVWSGHGFRVKVMSALAHGLPVVTNILGARGCTAPPPAVTTCNDASELAGAVARLLGSPDLARSAGKAAFEWASQNLQADALATWQLRRVTELLAPTPT